MNDEVRGGRLRKSVGSSLEMKDKEAEVSNKVPPSKSIPLTNMTGPRNPDGSQTRHYDNIFTDPIGAPSLQKRELAHRLAVMKVDVGRRAAGLER